MKRCIGREPLAIVSHDVSYATALSTGGSSFGALMGPEQGPIPEHESVCLIPVSCGPGVQLRPVPHQHDKAFCTSKRQTAFQKRSQRRPHDLHPMNKRVQRSASPSS
jgi:hypothetical protein